MNADRADQPAMILRQSQVSSVEARLVLKHALMSDVPCQAVSLQDLERPDTGAAWLVTLRDGQALPVGSVEFLRAAMAAAEIAEPAPMSYPPALNDHLHREVRSCRAGDVLGRHFVKPVRTKAFTGFVFDTFAEPEQYDEHDREQHAAFMALPADEMVWQSEPVIWHSEVRVYVMDGRILGAGRYDDGPYDAPLPSSKVIEAMVARMSASSRCPRSYALDAGVMSAQGYDDPVTALVEVNDAWALGYYPEGVLGLPELSARDYVQMLWRRWREILEREGARSGSSAPSLTPDEIGPIGDLLARE